MECSAGGMTATRGLAKIRVRARSTLLRNDPDTAAIFQERKFRGELGTEINPNMPGYKALHGRYASANSSCAHPPPPPPHRATRRHLAAFQSRWWGLSKFSVTRGPGISQPRGHPLPPRLLTPRWLPLRHGEFPRSRSGVCGGLA